MGDKALQDLLSKAVELKTKGNKAIKDGDRLTAYVAYDTAIKLLSSGQFKAVDGHYKLGRSTMAILFGNKAVTCMGVSHGNVIQFVQEALGMERTIYGERSLVGAPALVLSSPPPRDMNWMLISRNLKRRAEALNFFGSFCNLMADVQMQKSMIIMGLIPDEWTDAELKLQVPAIGHLDSYMAPMSMTQCSHSVPDKASGRFHRQGVARRLGIMLRNSKKSGKLTGLYATGATIMKGKDSSLCLYGGRYSSDRPWPPSRPITMSLEFSKKELNLQDDFSTGGEKDNGSAAVPDALFGAGVYHKNKHYVVGGLRSTGYTADSSSNNNYTPVGMDVWCRSSSGGWTCLKASQAKGHIPPCLAWHTAVVMPSYDCMLIYGGALITEEAKGKYECRTANWDTFAYYLKENRWTRMPRQKTDPGREYWPYARFGHVAWEWRDCMFIFGGRSPSYHKNTRLESADWKTMLLNDLWCYVYASKTWVEVRGSGLTPSPRANMGLAVADKGRRVYIVGGHFGLMHKGDSSPNLECYLQQSHNLSAEIFELDLGEMPLTTPTFIPLQDYISQGTSHWRQVTPTEKGEDWITGRAWPACYLSQETDSDIILVIGGDIKAMSRKEVVAPSSAAVAIHLAPSYENDELQEFSEKELKGRLKRHSELSKAEAAKAEAKPPSTPAFGGSQVPQPAAAYPKRRMLGSKGWESDPIFEDMMPVAGRPGSYASDPASKEIKLFMDLNFKHPMKGCPLKKAAFHQNMRGPDTVYTGFLDRGGALGSLWMGVRQMAGFEKNAPKSVPEGQKMLYARTGWHFLQVLHVFNTQQAAASCFNASLEVSSFGQSFNIFDKPDGSDSGTKFLLTVLKACDEFALFHMECGFTSGGLQKDFLLLMALGRVFCKVYIRMPWPTNCRLLIIYFAQQFVKAATELAGQPMLVSCFRCGQEEELASLNTPAKVVKICGGCKCMRFCNECGPIGWKEGHNAGCYILQDKNSTPPVTPEAFMAIDQGVARVALEGVFERTGLAPLERGLRRGWSLTEAVKACRLSTDTMLGMIHMQVKFTLPWALVVHFEPAPKKDSLITNPFELFQICPPRTSRRSLEDIVGMKYDCKATLLSKQPGKVFTEEMTIGEFFGNSEEIPILLYYLHKL